jgi:hypothetical protein
MARDYQVIRQDRGTLTAVTAAPLPSSALKVW